MQMSGLQPLHILVADIGGSHVTAGICNMQSRAIAPESITRAEVMSKGSADDILSAWTGALKSALKNGASEVSGLSIAMPGPFDYQNGISYIKGLDKYESLYGMDIKRHLADSLKIDTQTIKFRNDAESTIAGEALEGAGKNHRSVLGITLGTGFGSAFSLNKVTGDINLGSDPYQESIADDYFSTRWFIKRYHDLTGIKLTGGVKELSAIAGKSAEARGIFKEYANNMADFLAKPVKQLNPEVLIICGNIAKASRFFLPYLEERLNTTTIKLAQLDENAPLIGAAAMFEDTAPINPVNK